MAKRSAGILLYRRGAAGLEVLLVHPGGPFWQRKDAGAWSLPKGEVADGEDELERALRRTDSGEWIAERQNDAAARSDTAIPTAGPQSKLRKALTKLKLASS